jgi:hypothetical protein
MLIAKCKCGHSKRFHRFWKEKWDEREPDESCFHFKFPYGGFCDCKKYEEVKKK